MTIARQKHAIRKLVLIMLVSALLAGTIGPSATALTRDQRRAIMRGSVLILPLKLENGRVVDIPWSGSGTIIDASGLILTNYHVVQETGDWDALGILVTTQSDQLPEPAFIAEIATKAPDLDLAVLRIVADSDGNQVDSSALNLSVIPVGDADDLELGDELSIFGYPGIGQGTITLTEGKVSGFVEEEGVSYTRAWIKTDAAISGGNSGGTAVDADGSLVGIPTLASEVDVRYIADTNGDGVIDENDSAVPTGGFINRLRPVNLAYPLINRAKSGTVDAEPVDPGKGPKGTPRGVTPTPVPRIQPTVVPGGGSVASGASFGPLVFASEITRGGEPVDPSTRFDPGITALYAFSDYEGMQDGLEWSHSWALDGVDVFERSYTWDMGDEGTMWVSLNNGGDAMPEGAYTVSLSIAGRTEQTGSAVVGVARSGLDEQPKQSSAGVSIAGLLLDADTGDAIVGGYVILLQPGVTVRQFARDQEEEQVAAIGESDRDGFFVTAPPVPRGYTYGVVVLAEGYEPLAEDDALPIERGDPDMVELDAIWLVRE